MNIAGAHLSVAPVQAANGMSQVHVFAHREDAPGVGQQPLDGGAQLEVLQAAGAAERIQQSRVDALRDHAASLLSAERPWQQFFDAVDGMLGDVSTPI